MVISHLKEVYDIFAKKQMIWKKLYSFWGGMSFMLILLLLLPFFWLTPNQGKYFIWSSHLKKIWARLSILACFIPYSVRNRQHIPSKQPVIYCANHSSYFDIITMGLVAKGKFTFIGKSELNQVPVFGYVFKKFNITVNRQSRLSAFRALVEAGRALEDGKSVIFFPEGSRSKNPPEMRDFKEGAFRVAIEKQVPIVPVTLLFNWIILSESFLSTWHSGKAIIHPPIETKNLTLEDIDSLKLQTYHIINQELIPFLSSKKVYRKVSEVGTQG